MYRRPTMRSLAVILCIVLIFLLIGGTVKIGGQPILRKIDNMAGTDFFMAAHYGVFFFLYKERETKSNSSSDGGALKDFQERPLGFDKKKQYQKLDDAAKY